MTVAVYLPSDPPHTAAVTVCPEQHSSNCLFLTEAAGAARRCRQLVQSVVVSHPEAVPLNLKLTTATTAETELYSAVFLLRDNWCLFNTNQPTRTDAVADIECMRPMFQSIGCLFGF